MKSNKGMTDALRMQIIEEHLAGASKSFLAKKYNLPHGGCRIRKWMITFGVINIEKEDMTKKIELPEELVAENKRLENENKQLRQQLAKAEMGEQAWSTMIDIAEERWNIPIRKKPGTKQ